MTADCVVCGELDGTVPVPGDFLWETEEVVGFHAPPIETRNPRPYLGHLFVVTRRHVARLADLTEDEGAAVGRAATRLARALVEAGGAEWVYPAVIGTGVPHFHLHVLARYPGTPRGFLWHAIDEWEGGPHGGAPEIAEFAARLRASLVS